MSEYDLPDLERDYYTGNYLGCIGKANVMPPSRESIYYMCLSYCYLKKYDNLNLELSKWDDKACDLVRLYVSYIRDEEDKDVIIKKLDALIDTKSIDPNDELSRLAASALYARHKNYAKALQVIDRLDSLVANYNKILILILMNRGDLAEKKLSVLMKKDEQSPITELAQAQVFLVNRNPTQAWRIAGSLSDRYKPTAFLFNLQAVAAICLGEYDFAKQFCESALDMDTDNLEALINIVHISSKLRLSAAHDRNLERLLKLYPESAFVKGYNEIKQALY